jgi:hypothetical protein
MDLVTVLRPYGPTVMIHKNWQPRQTPSRIAIQADNKCRQPARCSRTVLPEASGTLESSRQKGRQRTYEFINSGTPKLNGREALKSIRRHVRKEFILNARQKKAHTDEKLYARSLKPHTNLPIAALDFYRNAPLTSFSEYPIDMQSGTHALLSQYLQYASSRMFPVGSSLKTSPLKSPEWFHFAVTDSAMFHAMLYAAAMYLALLREMSESRDTLYHQTQTISIIQQRLSISNQKFDDSTLGAWL